jgi:flavin reductase (DIM6/NTAB) family NADH-FMN oxidoreductase RutF
MEHPGRVVPAGGHIGGDEFRDVMSGVCAPVTIVTTTIDGRPHGATVSSFASLSLSPPMVSVALEERSSLLQAVLAAGRYGVVVLRDGQQDLASRFARRDVDRFDGTPWELDHGLPRLTSGGGWLVCELAEAVAGGDHMLLLGHVVHTRRASAPPLIYAHRTFGTHSSFAPASSAG